MLLSPSFLRLMFGAVLYTSPTYSPHLCVSPSHAVLLPVKGCRASGVSNRDVAG